MMLSTTTLKPTLNGGFSIGEWGMTSQDLSVGRRCSVKMSPPPGVFDMLCAGWELETWDFPTLLRITIVDFEVLGKTENLTEPISPDWVNQGLYETRAAGPLRMSFWGRLGGAVG